MSDDPRITDCPFASSHWAMHWCGECGYQQPPRTENRPLIERLDAAAADLERIAETAPRPDIASVCHNAAGLLREAMEKLR